MNFYDSLEYKEKLEELENIVYFKCDLENLTSIEIYEVKYYYYADENASTRWCNLSFM